ncbi:hypothetical protein AB0K14_14815 [Actinosynnema sp. NPDC050801]|uniref:hypothetical protein n=1 Tax=unclassified Actinosynnema TaxID=2637065 RepID=UPI0033C43615
MGLRRILVCAALVLGFGAVTVPAGSPVANADAVDCVDYLYWKHFDGFIISSACGLGEDGNVRSCQDILAWANVRPQDVVEEACRLAAQP